MCQHFAERTPPHSNGLNRHCAELARTPAACRLASLARPLAEARWHSQSETELGSAHLLACLAPCNASERCDDVRRCRLRKTIDLNKKLSQI